ncbi:hypothetical protein KOR42_08020 [Thalassoglobus neptunius]|uniref:Uncharacterized protein n=1 Tax=Thalassoglobus neptunius TaxID=1938619 RepID=A0A5C5X539_9PLAN|nr:hypothetical protein KOR42_08020 [Thalassoglobus neptunius]
MKTFTDFSRFLNLFCQPIDTSTRVNGSGLSHAETLIAQPYGSAVFDACNVEASCIGLCIPVAAKRK